MNWNSLFFILFFIFIFFSNSPILFFYSLFLCFLILNSIHWFLSKYYSDFGFSDRNYFRISILTPRIFQICSSNFNHILSILSFIWIPNFTRFRAIATEYYFYYWNQSINYFLEYYCACVPEILNWEFSQLSQNSTFSRMCSLDRMLPVGLTAFL